jgi:hypothetical protein
MYISNLKNQAAKNLLRKFWSESDSLHYDIDKLFFDQFAKRYQYLLNVLNRVMELEECSITVDLYNLIEKAKGKYGSMFDDKFGVSNLEKTLVA